MYNLLYGMVSTTYSKQKTMFCIGLIAKKRKLASIKMGILPHFPQLPFKTYEFMILSLFYNIYHNNNIILLPMGFII